MKSPIKHGNCSTSSIIRERQINASSIYYFPPIRLAIMKKFANTLC